MGDFEKVLEQMLAVKEVPFRFNNKLKKKDSFLRNNKECLKVFGLATSGSHQGDLSAQIVTEVEGGRGDFARGVGKSSKTCRKE
jgi:hypothetical protein